MDVAIRGGCAIVDPKSGEVKKMPIGFEYFDFNVWEDEEKRHASEEEVKEHVHFEIAEDGTCRVWCSDGFTITRR